MNDMQYRYSMLFQHCHEVEAQRDELLEALLEIKRLISEYAIVRRDGRLMGTGEAVSVGFVFERADRAIAKAKGEQ